LNKEFDPIESMKIQRSKDSPRIAAKQLLNLLSIAEYLHC